MDIVWAATPRRLAGAMFEVQPPRLCGSLLVDAICSYIAIGLYKCHTLRAVHSSNAYRDCEAMWHTLNPTVCSLPPESLWSTKRKQIQYSFGKEDMFIKNLEELNKIELKALLRLHREGALNAGKKLAAAFTAAATGFLDSFDDDDHDISDSDNTFDDSEEESDYDTEDDSSVDEDKSNYSGDDEYQYTLICDEDDTLTEDRDDSTFIEDDSDEHSCYSTVDDDVHILVRNFHELMKQILEHNSAACLIQFMLNKHDGKENDGSSLIQAMLPWTFSLEDRVEADILLELDNLRLVVRKP